MSPVVAFVAGFFVGVVVLLAVSAVAVAGEDWNWSELHPSE